MNQSWLSPRSSSVCRQPIPAISSASPSQSTRSTFWAKRESRTKVSVIISARMPSGTLM